MSANEEEINCHLISDPESEPEDGHDQGQAEEPEIISLDPEAEVFFHPLHRFVFSGNSFFGCRSWILITHDFVRLKD